MSTGLLLSGGMDSVALAYLLRPEFAFTIDYGQKCAEAEIRTSQKIASELAIQHEILRVDCSSLGSGDLAGALACDQAPSSEWWPYRNQLLITLAAMKGISLGVTRLLIGSVASDDSHADGRAEFVSSIDGLLSMQEGRIRVEAPAIKQSTVELVRMSGIPASLLCWAHSCHTGNYACGVCRGCNKHRFTMSELGYGSY